MRRFGYLLTLIMAMMLCATASFAQDGKLKIKVIPQHAYVFVDGRAIRDGNETISLSSGKHVVVVSNYGYKISTQEVNIDSGKTTDLNVALEAYGAAVNGPYGQIEFKGGDSHAAVLLNGKTLSYFVGHVGATNHDWWWHRNLLVPPGIYHVDVEWERCLDGRRDCRCEPEGLHRPEQERRPDDQGQKGPCEVDKRAAL